MRIKANHKDFLTYLDKKRFLFLGERPVSVRSIETCQKRKIWKDRLTGDCWAFVLNGYHRLDEVDGELFLSD